MGLTKCNQCGGRLEEAGEVCVADANTIREIWVCVGCGDVLSFEREIAGY